MCKEGKGEEEEQEQEVMKDNDAWHLGVLCQQTSQKLFNGRERKNRLRRRKNKLAGERKARERQKKQLAGKRVETQDKDGWSADRMGEKVGGGGFTGPMDSQIEKLIVRKLEMSEKQPEGGGESGVSSRVRVCVCVLVCAFHRSDEPCSSSPGWRGRGGGVEQRLQVKIKTFDGKMDEEEEELVGEEPAEEEGLSPSAPQRRHSLSQAMREERREMRFSRWAELRL